MRAGETTHGLMGKVEYLLDGVWVFNSHVWGATEAQIDECGKEIARGLWRQGVAGVRISYAKPVVLFERRR